MQVNRLLPGEINPNQYSDRWYEVVPNAWIPGLGDNVLGINNAANRAIIALYDPANERKGYLSHFDYNFFNIPVYRQRFSEMLRSAGKNTSGNLEACLTGLSLTLLPEFKKITSRKERQAYEVSLEECRRFVVESLQTNLDMDDEHINRHWLTTNLNVGRVALHIGNGTFEYEVGKIDPNEPPELAEDQDRP